MNMGNVYKWQDEQRKKFTEGKQVMVKIPGYRKTQLCTVIRCVTQTEQSLGSRFGVYVEFQGKPVKVLPVECEIV